MSGQFGGRSKCAFNQGHQKSQRSSIVFRIHYQFTESRLLCITTEAISVTRNLRIPLLSATYFIHQHDNHQTMKYFAHLTAFAVLLLAPPGAASKNLRRLAKPQCGDLKCNGGETSSSCPGDCGGPVTTTVSKCCNIYCMLSFHERPNSLLIICNLFAIDRHYNAGHNDLARHNCRYNCWYNHYSLATERAVWILPVHFKRRYSYPLHF